MDIIKKLESMVYEAIETRQYSLIRDMMELAAANGVCACELDDSVAIEDNEIFFNGAF